MVASAKAAHIARQGAEYGFDAVPIRVDLKKVKARKDAIVEKSRSGLTSWLTGMPGGRLVRGVACFEGPGQIRVGDELLSAKHIFVNVGARPRVPEFPGIGEVPYLTSTTILDLEELPEHLIVVGGSYVGLELAQMFRRFGSEVTVVERGGKLLGHEDDDAAQEVREVLEAEGVAVRTGAECIRLASRNGKVAVQLTCGEGAPEVTGSHILLAVGRRPNTDTLSLDKAGLSVNGQGFIEVDDQLRTAVEGIWALGDCNGRGAFTHTSYNDYEIVAANLLDNANRRVTDRIPASALYIDPPLARVGMNERQVRERGKPAMVGYRPMTKVSRAIEKGETRGFMKVLTDAESGEILGGTVFGVGGDEAIHCLLPAMYAHQPWSLMTHSVHIHPTVAELIPTVFGELKPLR
jgi:pyruvate/2-oxoglutarate dehydrogenase complex dihydrolipoamide dehydrogenase (E3) component